MSRKHLISARASSLTGPPRSPSASHLVPAGARSTAWGRPWEFPKPPSSEFATISKRNTTWTREQNGAAAPPSEHTPCHHTAPGVPPDVGALRLPALLHEARRFSMSFTASFTYQSMEFSRGLQAEPRESNRRSLACDLWSGDATGAHGRGEVRRELRSGPTARPRLDDIELSCTLRDAMTRHVGGRLTG